MESRITEETKSIWQEDPLQTYREFLQYANDGVKIGVDYNMKVKQALSLFAPPESKQPDYDLKVAVHNGEFYPFSTVIHDTGFYCSKLTITNFINTYLIFDFSGTVYPGTVQFFSLDEKLNEQVQVAYRNIVPSEFEFAKQLAGPMGYHEYLIDGKNSDSKALKFIRFIINSDLQNTPIRIVIKNCTNIFTQPMGISKEDFAERFVDLDTRKDDVVSDKGNPSNLREFKL